jgi:hypothetical protein
MGEGASGKASKRSTRKGKGGGADDQSIDFVTQMTKQLGLDGKVG